MRFKSSTKSVLSHNIVWKLLGFFLAFFIDICCSIFLSTLSEQKFRIRKCVSFMNLVKCVRHFAYKCSSYVAKRQSVKHYCYEKHILFILSFFWFFMTLFMILITQMLKKVTQVLFLVWGIILQLISHDYSLHVTLIWDQ